MTNEKKVPVSFVIYEPYEDWAAWKMRVGSIPADMANKFLQTIADDPRKDDSKDCIDYMYACYESRVSVMRGENECTPRNEQKKCDIFSGEIELSGFFRSDDDCGINRCPLCVQNKNRKRSEQNKMHTCANTIQAGKCVDPLMRKLAVMMYPEKYNEKQK